MSDLPIVVIGAGPSGLAAAAQLASRNLPFLVVESGERAGASVREWAHIRLFSPWSEIVDPQAARLLAAAGWVGPDPGSYPTGGDWVQRYLQPLADLFGDQVRYRSTVVAVSRRGRDRLVDAGRDSEPFVVHVSTPTGRERLEARAVIDASGTWKTPNPLGGDGVPAVGEAALSDRISYRVPDLRNPGVRSKYAGKHVVVAGSGHSALTALAELAELAERAPGTRISWLVRRASGAGAFGGGADDQLPARGALGLHARQAVAAAHVTTVTRFRTAAIAAEAGGTVRLESIEGAALSGVDQMVVVTGFRPDLSMLSEIRLDLDPVLQSPRALAPLIDPNVHSCGSVEPHGAVQLAQPEHAFYLVGMKSYGRAPSFLALTGYEQVRSVVAEIAGDTEAAARVELRLLETGVCGGAGLFDAVESEAGGGCCVPSVPKLLSIGSALRTLPVAGQAVGVGRH